MSNTVENISEQEIWHLLEAVCDPEIPVLNVVEMGIVREVVIDKDKVEVTITPTYSGCPAMNTIENDIAGVLKNHSIPNYRIETILSPAWTTDWMTDGARDKLRKYGIAPPEKASSHKSLLLSGNHKLVCPQCGSSNSERISQFGSTACKALYKCKDCLEPFEYFKCI